MADAFHNAPALPPDYQAKRFFEISPSRVRDADVGLSTDDWFLAPLTTTMCFAALEALYGKTVPSSGQFMFKKRPKAIPDYVWATGKVPIVTAIFKAVVEAMAPGEAEFRPFAMRWPDDEPVAGEWYLMNILNLVDCFDFERMGWPRPEFTTRRPITGDVLTPFEVWFQARLDQNYQSRPVYIDPQPAGLLHIWRPLFHSDSVFCTSELLGALKAAGVKRLNAERLGTREHPIPVTDWAALGVRAP